MADILIIDDDKAIRTTFERILTKVGHSVKCAENGRVGLELLMESMPDLVISDIMMPDTDGLEVIMAIKGMGESIPVIAISGGAHSVTMDFLPVAKALGASRILHKPITIDELLAAVQDALDKSRGQLESTNPDAGNCA